MPVARSLAAVVLTLSVLAMATSAGAVPVAITYSITEDFGSSNGVPGVLGGRRIQGGSVEIVWSMTSIDGAFTGVQSIRSLRLTNSYGTISFQLGPPWRFRNSRSQPSIFFVPAPPTLTALNPKISYLGIWHRRPEITWDIGVYFGYSTGGSTYEPPTYFTSIPRGMEISRVVLDPELPALGAAARALSTLALLAIAHMALRRRVR